MGSLSNSQFGFRKGRSTIDWHLKKWVDDSVRNRETAVSLDIANTFNSLSWSVIHSALEPQSKADIRIFQMDIG